MVLAMVPAAPPTRKNLRATSWPAPISAKVPYLLGSRLIWRAFSSVPISICGFMQFLYWGFAIAANLLACALVGRLCQTPLYLLRDRSGVWHRRPTEVLQPHSLSVLRWNPAAQIIW